RAASTLVRRLAAGALLRPPAPAQLAPAVELQREDGVAPVTPASAPGQPPAPASPAPASPAVDHRSHTAERPDADCDESDPHEQVSAERSFGAEGLKQVKAAVLAGDIQVCADSPGAVKVTATRVAAGGSSRYRERWLKETRIEIASHDGIVEVTDV